MSTAKPEAKKTEEQTAMVPAGVTGLDSMMGDDGDFSIPTEWGNIDVKDLLDRGFTEERFYSLKNIGSHFYGVFEKEGAGITSRTGTHIPTFHFHDSKDVRKKAFVLGTAQITAKMRNANPGDVAFITRIGTIPSAQGYPVGNYRIFVERKGQSVIDTTATTKK
jgi:hypothetical protein